MTPRERALSVKLWWCAGECAGDALLCVNHQAIEQQIEEAVRVARRELSENRPMTY